MTTYANCPVLVSTCHESGRLNVWRTGAGPVESVTGCSDDCHELVVGRSVVGDALYSLSVTVMPATLPAARTPSVVVMRR